MTCPNGPGVTHYAGCPCHEERRREEVRRLEREMSVAKQRTAELAACSQEWRMACVTAERERDAALSRATAAEQVARGLGEALEKVRPIVEELAAEQVTYGAGGGCDPRDFDPDPECSTEAERAQHKADCEKAERGEPIDTLRGCHIDEGVAIVSYQGWGLGMYTYRDQQATEALAAIDAALAAWRKP